MIKKNELNNIYKTSITENLITYNPVFTFTAIKNKHIWIIIFYYNKFADKFLLNRYDITNKTISLIYKDDIFWLLTACYKTLPLELDYFDSKDNIPSKLIPILQKFQENQIIDNKLVIKKTRQRSFNSVSINSNFPLEINELYIINNKINLPYGRMPIIVSPDKLNKINLSHNFGIFIKNNKNEEIHSYSFIMKKKIQDNSYYHLVSTLDEELNTKVGPQSFGETTIHAPMRSILNDSSIQVKFHGFEENTSNLTFNIIIGLNNTFIKNTESVSIDESFFFISKKELSKKFNCNLKTILKIFPNSDTFICIKETATDKDLAYNIAKSKLEKFIYLFNTQNKNDLFWDLYNNSKDENNWFYYTKNQNMELSTSYFVEEENNTKSFYAFDTKESAPFQQIELSLETENSINNNSWFQKFISNILSDSLNSIEKKILESLKWISLSWKTNNINEKVFFTNTSMEYFSSFISLPKKFRKNELNSLILIIKTSLNNSDFSDSSDNIERIVRNSINSHSFLETINSFYKSIELELTEKNRADIKTVRNYRNQLTHGDLVDDSTNISVDTINRVNRMVSEALFRKIKYLYNDKP
ncbi:MULTISPECIES: hypothetical protein [unclassified Enterococcus]|uniref:hypothetical protein n=1 Tax=unclassified Enterococcus TaxID=2608891 RepID=UPI0015554DB3|nr:MULTISPECIES: hypothetical protein [unclassified Enterococcus]MBS7576102.1 hypothetical protein [Enterococcus sp. MMGLQ5-2]MBS7583335.1 hypothetical protein [Enterococcus sp. MMGLQ5-1]NPD11195.1 hypothetical protein [Enterococcus sp. MMGLQ5-1]NPD35938.1 hypothetical protein [Enterococcus sp. MMGLQ5-2]